MNTPAERHAETMRLYQQAGRRGPEPIPLRALTPKVCPCESPAISTEEDGERRCFWCGGRER